MVNQPKQTSYLKINSDLTLDASKQIVAPDDSDEDEPTKFVKFFPQFLLTSNVFLVGKFKNTYNYVFDILIQLFL